MNMNIYEVREISNRSANDTSHIAYVNGLNKVINFIISCCGGKIVTGVYEVNGKRKYINRYKKVKNNNGQYDLINSPLTKKQIKELIKDNKNCSFYGKNCGGYCFNGYDIHKLTIE